MDGFHLPEAPEFVEGCYDADFIRRVINVFKEGTEEEVSQHLAKGSARVGELLKETSFIRGSVAKRLMGTWELEEIVRRACEAEDLYEEWCKKYSRLFQDPLG